MSRDAPPSTEYVRGLEVPAVSRAQMIIVAIDACEDRKYDEAKRILSEVGMVLVRTRDAGVHFGELEYIANAQHGTYRVVLAKARRIWSWSNANTLNEIALHGCEGKISEPVEHNVIPQVIEVIPCTSKASKILSKLKW